MFKSLFELTTQLLGLAKDTKDNKDSIKAVQARLETVTDTLKQVIYELQRLKENEAHEREKMSLRLENVQLRSERSLPPATTSEHSNVATLQETISLLQQEIEALKERVQELESGRSGKR